MSSLLMGGLFSKGFLLSTGGELYRSMGSRIAVLLFLCPSDFLSCYLLLKRLASEYTSESPLFVDCYEYYSCSV